MKDEKSLTDKIERWLDGSLTAGEALEFEAQIATDPVLRAKTEAHRRARAEIDEAVFRDFKRKTAVWRTDLDNLPELPPELAEPKNPLKTFNKWAIAAPLLLALLAGAFWFLREPKPVPPPPAEQPVLPKPNVPVAETEIEKQETPTEKPALPKTEIAERPAVSKVPEDLLAQADEVENAFRKNLEADLRGQLMGESEDAKGVAADFEKAKTAFLNGNLEEAKRLLQPLASPGNPFESLAQKMLADVFYRKQNFREAAQHFEAFAKENPDARTEWRLGHYYLKDYPNSKVKLWRLLNEIESQDHRFKNEAKRLRENLERAGLKQ